MIFPARLKKGDSVYLLNIARKGVYDVSVVERTFETWGLHVIIGNTVNAAGFCQFADTRDNRMADLQTALDNPEIRAVFFLRGGYGTVQLLDIIDFAGFVKSPKWLIGYSDITYLHAHINRNFRIATIHATMLSGYATSSTQDLESLQDILFQKKDVVVFNDIEADAFHEVSGELVGGNLSILHTVIGTKSDLKTDGKILFLEDVFENLMSIERMLWAMKRSGKFDNLKALLLGDFSIPIKDNETSNCMVAEIPVPDETSVQQAFRIMVRNFFLDYDFPVVFGLAVGHNQARNIALQSGARVSLTLNYNTLSLTYLT